MLDTIFTFDIDQCVVFLAQLQTFPSVEPGYFLNLDDLFSLTVLRASFFDFVNLRLAMIKRDDNCFLFSKFGDLLENPVF